MPEGGYVVLFEQDEPGRSSWVVRFSQNNDPKPVDENVKKNLKIYPYQPGSEGSSIGSYLNGTGRLGALSKPVSPKIRRGHRQGHEHHSSGRLQLLRNAE